MAQHLINLILKSTTDAQAPNLPMAVNESDVPGVIEGLAEAGYSVVSQKCAYNCMCQN